MGANEGRFKKLKGASRPHTSGGRRKYATTRMISGVDGRTQIDSRIPLDMKSESDYFAADHV